MEKINENVSINFNCNNILLWIGTMNDRFTAWIGTEAETQKENVPKEKGRSFGKTSPLVEYKTDFENREEAVQYVIEKLKELLSKNLNENNLKGEDIQTIQNIFESGKNKIEGREVLNN